MRVVGREEQCGIRVDHVGRLDSRESTALIVNTTSGQRNRRSYFPTFTVLQSADQQGSRTASSTLDTMVAELSARFDVETNKNSSETSG
jgi:hypothetical protein